MTITMKISVSSVKDNLLRKYQELILANVDSKIVSLQLIFPYLKINNSKITMIVSSSL